MKFLHRFLSAPGTYGAYGGRSQLNLARSGSNPKLVKIFPRKYAAGRLAGQFVLHPRS
jgi:hypothetical protein